LRRRHRSKDVTRWKQHAVNFVINGITYVNYYRLTST